MTHADYFRFRTHASCLTDDELIHFDWFADLALWDCWSPPLLAEDAEIHMNLAFTPHTMEDREVIARLEQWHSLGLLLQELSDFDGKPLYFLTSAGGVLWAAERLPVWERFYRTEWSHGEQRFLVTAPNRKIASQFLRSAIRCRYINSYKRPRTYRLDGNWPDEGFPWPRFKRAWQLRICVKRDYHISPIWDQFEIERTGWSNPKELIALRLSGKLPWPSSRP